MTSIEVPDWVAAVALEACGEHFTGPDADMKRAITAALGAWVVPVGYRVSIPSEPELGHWLEDIGEVTHPDPETHTTLYSLRQEKPE